MCVVYGRLVAEVLYTSEGELGQSVASCRICADLASFRLGSRGVNGKISIFIAHFNLPKFHLVSSYLGRPAQYNVDQNSGTSHLTRAV